MLLSLSLYLLSKLEQYCTETVWAKYEQQQNAFSYNLIGSEI